MWNIMCCLHANARAKQLRRRQWAITKRLGGTAMLDVGQTQAMQTVIGHVLDDTRGLHMGPSVP